MKQFIITLTLLLAIVFVGIVPKAYSQGQSQGTGAAITVNLDLANLDTASLQSVSEFITRVAKNKQAAIGAAIQDSLKREGKSLSKLPFKIEEVYHYSFRSKRLNSMAVGYENYFKVSDFDRFVDEYLDQKDEKSELVFFANGKPFPSVKLFLYDVSNGTISFMVSRADTLTQKFMQSFVSKFMYRIPNPVVGFGYYDKQTGQWEEVVRKEIRYLDLLKPYTLGLVVVWFIFLLVFFYTLGKNTNLLKGNADPESPYSLSLAQFAFWTVVIFTSYFYLWIIDFKLSGIPQTTLVLLGITAATTASSRSIDMKEGNKNCKKTTGRFFNDLLIDGDSGYSVHRSQLLLVTIMFGGFYLFEVIKRQTLPDFDNSLLWLIGISSGTFVGIKSVEGLKAGGTPTAPQTTGPTNPIPPNIIDTTTPKTS